MSYPDSITILKTDDVFTYEEALPKTLQDSIYEIQFGVPYGISGPKDRRQLLAESLFSRWAVETNVISWAMLRPNAGVEYAFAPQWSAILNFDIAWWRQRSKDRFYQLWTLSPEIRYWFGGYCACRTFYVGAHLLSGSYDLKNGRIGYRSESLVEAGLSVGFVMRFDKRWALRFGLGGGYLNTSYQKYTRNYDMGEHYVYEGTSRTTYWGITKAEASLRWNFGIRK